MAIVGRLHLCRAAIHTHISRVRRLPDFAKAEDGMADVAEARLSAASGAGSAVSREHD
jgi:hypothetical protein